jgi:hypothetical protein
MLERTHPDRFARQNQLAFGPKQARALIDNVVTIVREEIDDFETIRRLQKRITAAMRAAWDMRRTGSELRHAMEYFARKERPPFDPFDLPIPPIPRAPSAPAPAPAPTAPSAPPNPSPPDVSPPGNSQRTSPHSNLKSRQRLSDDEAFRRLTKYLSDALGVNSAAPKREPNSASDTVT